MGMPRRDSTTIDSVTDASYGLELHQHSPILPYFVAAEADERIDSRVARYHVREGTNSPLKTYERLFDSQPFPLGLWVPSKLDRLAEKLPGNTEANLEQMYLKSTLLPLFQQFGGDRFGRLNAANVTLAPPAIPKWSYGETGVTHLCMSCLAEDESEFGWPIIHRAHQIPGVMACWKHGTALMDKCPCCRCPFEPPNSFVLAPWYGCASCRGLLPDIGLPVQRQASDIEAGYAKFAKTILDVAPVLISSNQLLGLYRDQAFKLGYGRKSTINRTMLFEDVESAYGKELFAKMDHGYRQGRTDSWFHVMQSQNEEAPLHRHLMLSQFLFEDAGVFIEKIKLIQAGRLLPSSSKKRKRKSATLRATQNRTSNLLNELVEFARAKKLDIDGLWKAKYGGMYRLVRKQQNAIEVIENRLSRSKEPRVPVIKIRRPLHPADKEWAEKVTNVAMKLYASVEKPMRITINLLCTVALQKRNVYPGADACPQTHAVLQEWQETVWHFYARRLVWNARDLNGINPTESQLKKGLDYYRMNEVFAFMKNKLDFARESPDDICTVLKHIGIERRWEGPCPGVIIQRAGRAHKKGAGAFKVQAENEQFFA